MRAAALGLALALAGCGPSALSCTESAMSARINCVEFDNAPSGSNTASLMQSCTGNGGVWSNGPCDRKGALGGCELIIPNTSFFTTTWFYPNGNLQTAADVKATCDSERELFVAP